MQTAGCRRSICDLPRTTSDNHACLAAASPGHCTTAVKYDQIAFGQHSQVLKPSIRKDQRRSKASGQRVGRQYNLNVITS